MAETQADGAWGLNAAGSVSIAGALEPADGQRTFNVASVVLSGTSTNTITLSNPIPRTMGQLIVSLNGVAGLTWRLISWSVIGVIVIEIDLAGAATASAFDFLVLQTNLNSAGGT
jgi:hypothetical protein